MPSGQKLASIAQSCFSVTDKPVFRVEISHIAPPVLHIMLGFVVKIFDLLKDECLRLDMLDTGCDTDGNVAKALKNIESKKRGTQAEIKAKESDIKKFENIRIGLEKAEIDIDEPDEDYCDMPLCGPNICLGSSMLM